MLETSMKSSPILAFQGVDKVYLQSSGAELWALRGVNISVEKGRRIAITGRSGSGKSTFLHLAAGIDVPSAGVITFLGRDMAAQSEHQRTLGRRENVGLVFQFFHLLPHLTVEENVLLPGWIAGDERSGLNSRARELLDKVGLSGRVEDPAQMLSGGEMQRVAICRALLRRPRLILADEPTGNLDDENSLIVMDLLLDLVQEEGSTLVYVTHSPELADLADERWRLHSGILERI
jgi:ABC-type lipoprotein export system ATPase subunit